MTATALLVVSLALPAHERPEVETLYGYQLFLTGLMMLVTGVPIPEWCANPLFFVALYLAWKRRRGAHPLPALLATLALALGGASARYGPEGIRIGWFVWVASLAVLAATWLVPPLPDGPFGARRSRHSHGET